ncbi:hypothetical protein HON15_02940, partial [Candidatus Woesearchaeota archaeon]|nr:hypothetical protein [Candidatus Woesearchaeota archaeon]
AKEKGLKANSSSADLIEQLSSISEVSATVAENTEKTSKVVFTSPVSAKAQKKKQVGFGTPPMSTPDGSTPKKSLLRTRIATPCIALSQSNNSTPDSCGSQTPTGGSTAKKTTPRKRTPMSKMKEINSSMASAITAATSSSNMNSISTLTPATARRRSMRKSTSKKQSPISTDKESPTVVEKIVAVKVANDDDEFVETTPQSSARKSIRKSTSRKSMKKSTIKKQQKASPEAVEEAVEEEVEAEVEEEKVNTEDFTTKRVSLCEELLMEDTTTSEAVEYELPNTSADVDVERDMRNSIGEWGAVMDDDDEVEYQTTPVARVNQSANSNTLDAPTAKKANKESDISEQTKEQVLTSNTPTPTPILSPVVSKSLPSTPVNNNNCYSPRKSTTPTPVRAMGKITHLKNESFLKVMAKSRSQSDAIMHDDSVQTSSQVLVPKMNKSAMLMMQARQAKEIDYARKQEQLTDAAQPGLRLATKMSQSQLQRNSTNSGFRSSTSSQAHQRQEVAAAKRGPALVPSCATRITKTVYVPPEVPTFKAKSMPNFKSSAPVVAMTKARTAAIQQLNKPKPISKTLGLVRPVTHCSDIYKSTTNTNTSKVSTQDSKENGVNLKPTRAVPFKLSTSNRNAFAAKTIKSDFKVKSKGKKNDEETNKNDKEVEVAAVKVKGQKTPAKNPFEMLSV